MLLSCFDPPEPPIQFADEDDLCEHGTPIIGECPHCEEEEGLTKSDNNRKEDNENN